MIPLGCVLIGKDIRRPVKAIDYKERKCSYCGRVVIGNRGAFVSHQNRCHDNPDRETHHMNHSSLAGPRSGNITWCTGMHLSASHREHISLALTGKVAHIDPQVEAARREKLSIIAKETGLGGYHRGSGRGRHGWYRGIWCDSSWELAFVMMHLDFGTPIHRCEEVRTYVFNGVAHKYHPDFVVNGLIYEIKGYVGPAFEAKMRYNSDIIVIGKIGIAPYLQYAVSHYGKDFIRKYETRNANPMAGDGDCPENS